MWTFAGLNYMYYVKIWLPYLTIDLKKYVHVIVFSKKIFHLPKPKQSYGQVVLIIILQKFFMYIVPQIRRDVLKIMIFRYHGTVTQT